MPAISKSSFADSDTNRITSAQVSPDVDRESVGPDGISNHLTLSETAKRSSFYSFDMAPVVRSDRHWSTKDMAVLWISMAACIPTYTTASSAIDQGMSWWQAVLTILLANAIVLIPMLLNAHAGTKYGISFPVYCRSSYGILGANLPALLRALVACGWFGIQVWIGGAALHAILLIIMPSLADLPEIAGLGIDAAQFTCFMVFWAINMAVVFAGIESIRFLLNIKAPLLIGLGLLFLAWAYYSANGFGPMLSRPSAFGPGGTKEGQFWNVFFPVLTANVGFWATLSLNIPDFSRYARSQKSQILGQSLGLPTTMALFSFIGIAVTSSTFVIFGKTMWDPIDVLRQFSSPVVLVFSMLAICLATLATNIAANVVSPANDFAHLWPTRITFRIGGLITGIIGILIQPWRLVADPTNYIFTWLIAYSALLGSVAGVLIADYFVLKRTRLHIDQLYLRGGEYWYSSGFHWKAIIATIIGIVPCVPGFIATVAPNLMHTVPLTATFLQIYQYAWFISFSLAAISYIALNAFTIKISKT